MKISRRSFITKATAAAVTPLILPGCVTAAKTSEKELISKNDLIRVGFIGMGIQNRGLLDAFLHSNASACWRYAM